MSREGAAGGLAAVGAAALKNAFAQVAAGVAIVTTRDAAGVRHGFTASSFVPLSVAPPMVLVCLNRGAECFPAFGAADGFTVSLLGPQHRALALRFATRGAAKFAGDEAGGGDGDGDGKGAAIPGALARFDCKVAGRFPGGDHVILTGTVTGLAAAGAGEALVHFRRGFHTLGP